jgi:hypothetical protein
MVLMNTSAVSLLENTVVLVKRRTAKVTVVTQKHL